MKKRIFSLILVLALCLSLLPTAALASELTASGDAAITDYGPFLITGLSEDAAVAYANNVLTISGGAVTVGQNSNVTAITDNCIVVQGTATVTLDGVNITHSTNAPLTVEKDSTVTICLVGNNYLTCTGTDKNSYGLYGEKSPNIEIQGTGSLTLSGGEDGTNISISEKKYSGACRGIINAGGTYIIGGAQTLTEDIVIESGKKLVLNQNTTLNTAPGKTIFIKYGGSFSNPSNKIGRNIIFFEVVLNSKSLTGSVDKAEYAQRFSMILMPKDEKNYRHPLELSDENINGAPIDYYNPDTGELSVKSVSYPIAITAEAVEKTYGLSVTAPDFDSITYGDTPAAQSISITNTGNSNATIQSVTVSGEAFEITGSGMDYQIQPKADLDVGAYKETITVTYNNNTTATADVSVAVKPKTVTVDSSYKVSKPYDGTTAVTADGIVPSNILEKDQASVKVTAALEAYDQPFVHSTSKELSLSITGNTKGNYVLDGKDATISVPYEITAVVQTPTIDPTASVLKTKTLDLKPLVTHIQGGAEAAFTIAGEDMGCSITNGVLTAGDSIGNVTVQVRILGKDLNSDSIDEYAALKNAGTIQVSVMDKSDAGVTLGTVPTAKTYGDQPFAIAAAAVHTGEGNGIWTWTSSDDEVLTVDNRGNVTVTGAGTATVTAHYESETTIGQAVSPAITVSKKQVTVIAADKSIYTGSAIPSLSDPVQGTDYTVTGLVGQDALVGAVVLSYEKDGSPVSPSSSTAGTYEIVISGVTVPDSDNYEDIVLQNGTLTITRRPSSGGSSNTTSTTDRHPDGSVTTTTTNKVTGTVTTTVKEADGSTSKTEETIDGHVTTQVTLSGKAGDAVVADAKKNSADHVVIAPEIPADADKTAVSIPAATVKAIGRETGADLTVSTPVADVHIPNGALDALAHGGGQVTVTAEKSGSTVTLAVTAGRKTVTNLPGGITMTVPLQNAAPGTVAVLVKPDGAREIIRKSAAVEGQIQIPLDGSAKVELIENSKDFKDTAGHWASAAIDFVTARELYAGTGADTFTPDGPMTRGMLARVLHNLENNPDCYTAAGRFSDVAEGHWATAAIRWAAVRGIAGGYPDGSYGPERSITREQLAVMLWRYAGAPKAGQLSGFGDAGSVSSYAADAMAWAVETGLINGMGGRLNPQGTATRSQVAAIIMRLCQNLLR